MSNVKNNELNGIVYFTITSAADEAPGEARGEIKLSGPVRRRADTMWPLTGERRRERGQSLTTADPPGDGAANTIPAAFFAFCHLLANSIGVGATLVTRTEADDHGEARAAAT